MPRLQRFPSLLLQDRSQAYQRCLFWNRPNISFTKPKRDSSQALSAVRELLKHKEIDVNQRADTGESALMTAAIYNASAVELLLQRNDIDVNIVDAGGMTALMYSCRMPDAEPVMSMLLGTPGIKIAATDKDNFTAYSSALAEDTWMAQMRKIELLCKAEDIDPHSTTEDGRSLRVWVKDLNELATRQEGLTLAETENFDLQIQKLRAAVKQSTSNLSLAAWLYNLWANLISLWINLFKASARKEHEE